MELIIKETEEVVKLVYYHNEEDITRESGLEELVLEACFWDEELWKYVIRQDCYDNWSRIVERREAVNDKIEELGRDLINAFGSEETERIIEDHFVDLHAEFGEEYGIAENVERMRRQYLPS